MSRARAVVPIVVGCALAAAAAANGPYLSRHDVPETDLEQLLKAAARRRQQELLNRQARVRAITWEEIVVEVVLGVVLLVFVGWLAYRLALLVRKLVALRFRRGGGAAETRDYDPGDEVDGDVATQLRKRVRDELAALSADLDAMAEPREAVIACYVRMEHAFASAGAARRLDESPMELLSRVLAELRVPEADVRRLTELFAEARFSAHPVTDEMRAAARRSLAAVTGALAVSR